MCPGAFGWRSEDRLRTGAVALLNAGRDLVEVAGQ